MLTNLSHKIKPMKHYLLFLLCGFSLMTSAQDKITFSYDNAGNQVKRELCINCSTSRNAKEAPKEIIALKSEDLQKFYPEEAISYYPNPVKEELYLKWDLIQDNFVSSIYVYALNGQVIKSYSNLNQTNNQNIPFQSYPSGVYAVVLFYKNGEQKTIKIIKQ